MLATLATAMKVGEVSPHKYILGTVKNGLSLSFDKDQPRAKPETDVLETEAEKFLKKGVISRTKIRPDDDFSNLFNGKKKDGSYRTILNLK